MNMQDAENWYKEDGPVSEASGERTWVGRLYDFETFRVYGQPVADYLREYVEEHPGWENPADDYPELAKLVMAVFPARK